MEASCHRTRHGARLPRTWTRVVAARACSDQVAVPADGRKVPDDDVIDLLDRLVGFSVELLAADAAGIVLSDTRGQLRAVAASSEAAEVMELLQLQSEQGPCLECVHNAAPVSVPDLIEAVDR